MKKLKIAAILARVLLGLVLFVFGLNFYLNFLPQPPLGPQGLAFIMSLVQSGYVMTLVKVIEVVCGALLLTGFYVPFALVLIAPVLANIVGFHTMLEPSGAPMAYVLLVLWAFLVWAHRGYYRTVFVAKATPST